MPSRKSFFIPNRYLHGRIVYCMPMDYNERLDDVWHHHDFDEIVVVCSGEGIHVAENGEYPIRKGDTFFIPCGEFHGYRNLKHLRIVNILFKKNAWDGKFSDLIHTVGYKIFFENHARLKEEFRFRNRLNLSGEQLQKCEKIFAEMTLEQSAKLPGCNCMDELLFLNFCVIICRAFTNESEKHFQEIGDICRLIKFMEERHAEPWKLENLAKHINRSVSSLTAMFRNAIGTSPIEYLNTIRLEQAAKELRETDHPVSSIAFSHGFTDSNYFSTRFTRHFGCSPREYRTKQKNLSGDL